MAPPGTSEWSDSNEELLATAGTYRVLVRRDQLVLVCSPLLAIGHVVEVAYTLRAPFDPKHDDPAAPWLQAVLVSRSTNGGIHEFPWMVSAESADTDVRTKTFQFRRRELTSNEVLLRTRLIQASLDLKTDWMILEPI